MLFEIEKKILYCFDWLNANTVSIPPYDYLNPSTNIYLPQSASASVDPSPLVVVVPKVIISVTAVSALQQKEIC